MEFKETKYIIEYIQNVNRNEASFNWTNDNWDIPFVRSVLYRGTRRCNYPFQHIIVVISLICHSIKKNPLKIQWGNTFELREVLRHEPIGKGIICIFNSKEQYMKGQWAWEMFHYRHRNFHTHFLCRKVHGNFLEPLHVLCMKVHRTKRATKKIMSQIYLTVFLFFFSCGTCGRNNALLNRFYHMEPNRIAS